MEVVPRTPPAIAEAGAFADAFGLAVQTLRRAFEETLRAIGANPSRPQDLSRRFGLNKNLTWKLSRLISSTDPAAAMRFVPGNSGLKILRDTLGDLAGPAHRVALEQAIEGFDAMVELHAGSRASLELLVQGLAHDRLEPETLESARKQAFQGNSAIWGVQARVQSATMILNPSADRPGWVDVLDMGALLDVRRIRPSVRWQLFARQTYNLEDGSARATQAERIVDCPGGAPLIPEFCSDPLPPIEVEHDEDQTRYILPGGPIGNTAQISCVYATLGRNIGPTVVDEEDAWTELGASLLTPVEHLQLDVLVHEDLRLPPHPEGRLLGRMDGRSPFAAANREGRTLPFRERIVDLGRGLTGLASVEVPRCTEMVGYALDQVGWDANRMRGWRYSMPFPPIPSSCLMAFPLVRRQG